MYVYSNELCNDDGEVLGRFTSHGAAVAAILRMNKPNYSPLAGWVPADLVEFERIKASH